MSFVAEQSTVGNVSADKINELATQLRDVGDKLSTMTEKRLASREKSRVLTKENHLLKQEIEGRKNQFALLHLEYQELEKKFKAENEKCEAKDQENVELQAMVDEFGNMWSQDSKKYTNALEEAKGEAERAQKAIFDLNAKCRECQEKIDDLESEVAENANFEIAFDLAVKKNEEIQQELTKAKTEHEGFEKHMRQVVQMKDNNNAALVEKHEWLNDQTILLKKAIDELFESREKTMDQLRALNSNIAIERQAYEGKIAELVAENQQQISNYNASQYAWNEELNTVNTQYKDFVSQQEQIFVQADRELKTALADKKQVEAELVSAKEDVARLQKELEMGVATQKDRDDAYQASLAEKDLQIHNLRASLDATNDRYWVCSQANDELDLQLIDTQMKLRSMTDDLKNTEERIELLLTESEYLHEEREVRCVEIEELKKKAAEAHVKYATELEMREAEFNVQIEKQYEQASNALQHATGAFTTCKRELSLVQEQFADACSTIESLNNELSDMKKDVTRITTVSNDLHKSLEEQQKFRSFELARYDHQVRLLGAMLARKEDAHKAEIAKMEKEREKLVENMGIEAYDDDEEEEEPETKSEDKEEPEIESEDEEEQQSWQIVD